MTGHGYDTGDSVNIASSTWTITRFDADNFELTTLTSGPGTTPAVGDTVTRNLKTTHCAFNPVFRDYLKAAYKEMADLTSAAALPIWLQHGENVWWFFAGGSPASMAYYDAKTKADAQASLGRPLQVFIGPNDDPSVNAYADANFLRNRLRDFCSEMRTHVKNTYTGAKFEVLWPFDVNEPGVKRLNRYVNLPAGWETDAGSRLHFMLCEALSFGAVERNFRKAKQAIQFFYTGGRTWPKSRLGYLVPWFNGGCPWEREYLFAVDEALARVGFWANDHIHLMGWNPKLPMNPGRARLL